VLRVLVDKRGKAEKIELESSSGHGMLDQAATEAAWQWRFKPGMRSGEPVAMWVKMPVQFRLK
jgi:protein TonB